MSSTSPGPIADRAFESGFRMAAVLGVVGSGVLFWVGVLSVTNMVHVASTVLFFPVYLLFAAVVLGVWLGYETDGSDLERVTEPADMETGDIRDWWP
jgi:hypothetical protein